MRILICGGREFGKLPASFHPTYKMKRAERDRALAVLDALMTEFDKDKLVIIHGGAEGADSIAAEWAKLNLRPDQVQEFKADWLNHGRSAGPIRNRKMYKEGQPDEVWAFPGDKGTRDMMLVAKEGGTRVRELMKFGV